jgi:hypothetical protein
MLLLRNLPNYNFDFDNKCGIFVYVYYTILISYLLKAAIILIRNVVVQL